jgi:hypothetical protein
VQDHIFGDKPFMTARFYELPGRASGRTESINLNHSEPASYKLRHPRSLSTALQYAVLVTIVGVCFAASKVALAQQSGRPTDGTSVANSSSKSIAIPEAWPADAKIDRLSDIGRGKAVIFSPDFAEPDNREFYEKLGFLYIEDASWLKALNQIIERNYWHPENRIYTIIIETHGTNGNGLKVQRGPWARAARSYISIGALQEKLDGVGVRLCVIGACNAGRLFRPEIYKKLNPQPHDRLFLPATLGIINASAAYDPSKSKMIVVRRAESELETTTDGDTSELSPIAREVLGLGQANTPALAKRPLHFAVSNLLIQMLIHDPRLKLTSSGYANEKSRQDLSEEESDTLFQRFLAYLNAVAAGEHQIAHGGK